MVFQNPNIKHLDSQAAAFLQTRYLKPWQLLAAPGDPGNYNLRLPRLPILLPRMTILNPFLVSTSAIPKPRKVSCPATEHGLGWGGWFGASRHIQDLRTPLEQFSAGMLCDSPRIAAFSFGNQFVRLVGSLVGAQFEVDWQHTANHSKQPDPKRVLRNLRETPENGAVFNDMTSEAQRAARKT